MTNISLVHGRTEPVLDLASCIEVDAADALGLCCAFPGSTNSSFHRKEPCLFGAPSQQPPAAALVVDRSADKSVAGGAAAVLSHPAVVWIGGVGLVAGGITAVWMLMSGVA